MKLRNVLILVLIFETLILLWVYIDMSTPRVHWSHSKDICVSVDDPAYSCDNLPDRYEKVWAK